MTFEPHAEQLAELEKWFHEEMPRLYRYLCYQTGDVNAAEEITSRAYEKAFAKIERFDPARGEMRVWLFGIARNELRMYFRSRKQNSVEVSLDSLSDFTVQGNSPEEIYQRKEVFIQILRELVKLPQRDQEIIALRYGAGLPVQQMAVIMGLEENHVGVLLHRVVNKLKKSLEEVTDER